MILEESDISIIKQLLQDYQWYVENYSNFFGAYTGHVVSPNTGRLYQELHEKFYFHTPLLLKALEPEMPRGFMILKTHDQCYHAFGTDSHLRIKGPTTEFQARLWCWKNASIIANSSEYTNVNT